MMKKLLILTFILLLQFTHAMTLTPSKTVYSTNDAIKITFNDMTGLNQDWIAIYPETSNNDWKNVMRWNWTDDRVSGSVTFSSLPAGNYEARAFYNNSYTMELSQKFSVTQEGAVKAVQIETRKEVYDEDERIQVVVGNMLGDPKDWVGIYPKGTNNDWENVQRWNWTGGHKATIMAFDGLKAGEYEARAFFKNSYKVEAKYSFNVGESNNGFIDEVRQHCSLENETIATMLCSNEPNIAYAIQNKEEVFHGIIYDFLRIDLNNNTVQSIETNQRLELQYPKESLNLIKLEDTPIYLYKKTSNGADTNIQWLFQYQGKTILSFYSNDRDKLLYDIHTTIGGKNLVLSYLNEYSDPFGRFTDTYNISNPNVATLIDREINPLR
ncbi:MAG: No hits [uncultured Sulfurovum sp.]|uniref:No hits n=1 Tax=uncultured Sulfurovum sp. TaxID=269237 RepID=A0A6S6SRP7_9BACT|nr:MAG: No hits [uncultured Sulfurovum sp.]